MMSRNASKLLLPAVLAAAAALSACGSDDPSERAAGSAAKPMVAHVQNESGTAKGALNEGATTSSPKSQGPARSQGSAKPEDASTNTVPGQPSTSAGQSGEAKAPGYDSLVENQGEHPPSRFSPCNLVSEVQARTIIGEPIQQPLEAPQGPTCIYRSQTGKTFISVAVQSMKFGAVKERIRNREDVTVANRAGYCGVYGQKMLYVPLNGGRVLSVGAPCPVAKQFAAKAVARIG